MLDACALVNKVKMKGCTTNSWTKCWNYMSVINFCYN